MAWGKRLLGKNRLADIGGQTCAPKSSGRAAGFYRARFEHLEDRRMLAPIVGDISDNFLPGSLICHREIAGEISSEIVDETFVVELGQQQTITAVVSGVDTFRPGIYISGPDGTNIGGGISDSPGDKAVAQTIMAQDAGSYTIHVYGIEGSTGSYDVDLTLNAAEEFENLGKSTNDSLATAESIDGSFIEFSGGVASRGAVSGELLASSMDEDWFSFSLDAGASLSLVVAADPGESQAWPPAAADRPQLELYDAQGSCLAMGVDLDITISEEATILGHMIDNFVADADGTFYARVVGQDLQYSLVVTVDTAFDLGNNSNSSSLNNDPALAPWEGGPFQDISDRQGVLGEIGSVVSGWTFMVYLDADNNLEGAGIEDFLEMAEIGSTEDVNIVVQFDRAFGFDYSYDDWTGTRRGLVNQGDAPDLNWGIDLGEKNMGDPLSVVDFVEWSMEEYPAGNYALIYWDHGNGIEGICTDSSSGSELEMEDLTTIIDATEPVNLVGFDACLMGMVEVGYQYRYGADVMVSSEATELLDGWEYQNFLDKLVADPSMNAEMLGSHIIDAFEARYDSEGSSTLSAVDLKRLGAGESSLAAGLGQFADWMISSATSADWDAVEDASSHAKRWSEPSYIDMGDFISRVNQAAISVELADVTDDVLDALDSVVLDNYGGRSAPSTGLSIYMPQGSGHVSATYDGDIDFVTDTQWDEFLGTTSASASAASSSASRSSGSILYDPSTIRDVVYGPVLAAPAGSLYASLRNPSVYNGHRRGTDLDGSIQSDTAGRGAAPEDDTFASGDWYCVEAVAGDWLTAWTSTPGGMDQDFRNTFDPYIELYDPNGQLLAADDNTVYGRNALVSHAAELSGRYWIRVDASPLYSSSTGEYFLCVLGPNGLAAPLSVSSAVLSGGLARDDQQPTSVTIEFSDQILLSTLDASDLIIDSDSDSNIEAVDFTVLNGNTISFEFYDDIDEGSHTLELAAGAVQDIQGTPVTAYASTFEKDISPPSIVGSSIQQGDLLPAGQLIYTVVFDQSLRFEELDTTDVVLTGAIAGQIEAVALDYNPETFTVTVEFPALGEGDYSLRLISGDGHFEDSAGNDLDGEPTAFPIGPNISGDGLAGGDFVVEFATEIDVMAIPGPAEEVLPNGSLIRRLTASGSISPVDDIDTFTVDLQAGQTLAAILDPSDTLLAKMTVIAPNNNNNLSESVSQTAGQDVFHQATATVDGTYIIIVKSESGSAGDYDLQVIINAGVEEEPLTQIANNTLLTAESLDGTFIPLDGVAGAISYRAAVLGSLADGQGDDFYSFSLDAQQTAAIVLDSNSVGEFTVKLLDSSGNLLAISASSENARAAIHGFVADIPQTYYLRVIGEADYSMVITRDAEFDGEPNDTFLAAQDISASGGALGFVDASADDDWYLFAADIDETITVETFLPLGVSNLLASSLNPAIELYDPQGNLLSYDDNSAGDGINASIVHVAAQTGSYRLRVLAQEGRGDYYVRVDSGNSVPSNLAPQVIGTDPADGAPVALFPTTYTVDFSEQLLIASIQPGDLKINGVSASDMSIVDGDTISFELDPQLFSTPVDGIYNVVLAAGAVTDLQGMGNQEFVGTFNVDNTGPRIIATMWNGESFPTDGELPAGRFEFEAIFDEILYTGGNIRTISADDVSLVNTITLDTYLPDEIGYDPQADRFRVVYDYLPHGSYQLELLSQDGGFEDVVGNNLDGEFGPEIDGTITGDGIPGGNYTITFDLASTSQVVGRHVFYNNSQWDGNNAAAGADDDSAIATDKCPLLPGETASFENYTSYDKGINGIMIDVHNLLPNIIPSTADFTFHLGNNNDPTSWSEAPEPLSITLRRGEGVDGSDRISIIWADGAISKQWLQVTMSGQQMGLAADDVFYWGNAVGESGDNPSLAFVNATDVLAARDNPHDASSITNLYDYNRDGLVDAIDVVIAQTNQTSPLTALRLIEVPTSLGEAAARSDSSEDSDTVTHEDLIDLVLRDGLI